jgi:SAM-dependent methyltransferase
MVDKKLNYGRHHIQNFLEKSMPYSKVVDLGAGFGDDLLLARKFNPNVELFALENFPSYVKELEGKNIKVFSSNIERDKLPFEDGSVDVIIMNQILEHVKEVFWIMHEVTRVLRTGGHFIVGIPNLASLHNRLLLMAGMQPTCIQNDSAHVRGYTKKDFSKLLNCGFKGGYELVNFGGSNFYPFPPFIAKPLATIFPSMAWGIFMNWKKIKKYEGDYIKYPMVKQLETNFYLGPGA